MSNSKNTLKSQAKTICNCNFPGDLADVVRREGAGGEEVVAAAALEAANQLTHVCGVVVLGRARRAQLGRPELEEDLLHNNK